MHLVVKLRFGFLSKYFPQANDLCSYFAVIDLLAILKKNLDRTIFHYVL